jgi:oxaloacetate decarboxylase gamma subunit
LPVQELSFSYQNILAGQGFGLAFAGLSIVFVALGLVALFVALLPRVLWVVNHYIPEEHGPAPPQRADELEVVAAIGYALHARMQKPLAAP